MKTSSSNRKTRTGGLTLDFGGGCASPHGRTAPNIAAERKCEALREQTVAALDRANAEWGRRPLKYSQRRCGAGQRGALRCRKSAAVAVDGRVSDTARSDSVSVDTLEKYARIYLSPR